MVLRLSVFKIGGSMKKNTVGILLVFALALGGLGLKSLTGAENSDSADRSADESTVEVVKELQIEDEVVGTGKEAKPHKTVSVHYTGTLYPSGEQFDSSYDHGSPFSFQLGEGQVIEGWDKGVAGMKVGGKRKLIIPPDMAYGLFGHPPVIPPSATLKFEVELLDVQ